MGVPSGIEEPYPDADVKAAIPPSPPLPPPPLPPMLKNYRR